MSNSMIATLKARRKADKAELEDLSSRISAAPASAQRGLAKRFDDGLVELKAVDDRIEELEQQDAREGRAAAHRVEMNAPGGDNGSRFYTTDADVYHDPHLNPQSPSFFADVRNSRMGDFNAAERLQRNTAARGLETRAGDMTTVAGAGGTFAPPAWLVDQFVALARPGRVTADLFQQEKLPSGVSSINLPKVASGATTAVQATQNSALSDTAMTTTSVSSGISLIGGKQIISLQLLQQSGIPFDRVILGDLAADYAKQLDLGALAGAGTSGALRGLLNAAGTSDGPVAQGAAGKIAGLPVYLDANVTITTGAGAATNQDLCYVLRGPDLSLWESDLAVESFEATYADNASVLFRCLAYSACIPDRYAGSVNLISGTGLVAPVL